MDEDRAEPVKAQSSTMEEGPEEEVKEEIRKTDLSHRLVWVSLASSTITLFYGYNIWIIYSPSVLLREFYNSSSFHVLPQQTQQTVVMGLNIALFPLGGLFGALLVGHLADTFGRKGTLTIVNIIAIISSFLMGFSHYMYVIEFSLFARLLLGLSSGLISNIVPLYLGEIAPRSHRGAIILLPHFYLNSGVLLAQILGLKELLGNKQGWPIFMGLAGFAPLIQAFLLPFIPESPRYLMIQKKNEEQARKVLKLLRETENVEDEMEEMRLEDFAEGNEKKMNFLKLIRTKSLRWHVISISVIIGGSQFSGINVAYFYTERILLSMNLGVYMKYFISPAISLLSFSTLLSVYLIDSVGRRAILLSSFGMICIISLLLTISLELQIYYTFLSYLSSLFIVIFIAAHNFGSGPLPHVLIVELFLQSSRASAFVISGSVFWTSSFVIGMFFFHMEKYIGIFSFLLFWPTCTITFLYIFRMIPETKKQTFLDIRKLMVIQTKRKIHAKDHRRKKNVKRNV